MSGPRRWTIKVCSGCNTPEFEDCRCPLEEEGYDQPVEVMPVSEHERWREAFLGGQRVDHARCDELRAALERIVREDHEGGAGWMAEIAQAALDGNRGQKRAES